MGFREIEIRLRTGYSLNELKNNIANHLNIKDFSYTIEKKSLDARNKKDIHWLIKTGVLSDELKGGESPALEAFVIPFRKRNSRVAIVGSGPAGFFAGIVLQRAGFNCIIIEQGPEVEARARDIANFEKTGTLNDLSNYAFGEGGAGTFSDGKLTSRTKSIKKERIFIFDELIKAGAPAEIAYLSSPHLGSDNLKIIVPALRRQFIEAGGSVLFNTKVTDIIHKNGLISAVATTKGDIEANEFIFAIGHSSYDTYRMLISKGVPFRPKPLAIGFRAEHLQEEINITQWGTKHLEGLKAAEYKLTFNENGLLPVYSFCMCPGGKVVPAAPKNGLSVVNGMSDYMRNSKYANSAIVAGVDLSSLLKKQVNAAQSLDWLEELERRFYNIRQNYDAPANTIAGFIGNKVSQNIGESSYPFKLFPYDFDELMPSEIISSLRAGLKYFCKRNRSFENGILLGLESKTSSPIQVEREAEGRVKGFANLYMCGEGSGWAGGIVSSAADGVKCAQSLANLPY